MSRGRRVLNDIRFYSTAIVLTQIVTVVASILTRRLLGPVQMGVWVYLQVLLNYTEFSALGTTTAASLEIPLLNGKQDREGAQKVANAAFSFALITSLGVAAATLAYAFARRTALGQELFYGFLMAAVFVVLQRFNSLAITLVRADKQFVLAGKQMLYSSIVNIALIAFFSYRFKLYGFLAAMALSLIFNIAYLTWRAGIRVRFVADWPQMKALILFGFPLITIGLASTAFETMDPLFIKHFLGFETLGLYSVALMTINYLNAVPNSVGVVTISHLQEKVGESGDKAVLAGYLKKVDAGYGFLMALLIGGAWFMVPWLVRLALPDFVKGIPALQCLALSTFFTALIQGYTQLVYAIRKHHALLVITAVSCVVAAGTNLWAIMAGTGVIGIAAATVFSTFFYFTLLFVYTSAQVEPLRRSVKRYALLIGGFAAMTMLLLLVGRVRLFDSLRVDAWAQMAVYALVLSPFLWRMRHEFGRKIA